MKGRVQNPGKLFLRVMRYVFKDYGVHCAVVVILILAGVLYWIVMKVYASMKKVDTVTFTEPDQVL